MQQAKPPTLARRLPVGAEPGQGGTDFRIRAPTRRRVEILIGDGTWPLEREQGGWFAGRVEGAGPGTLYRFRLDGETAVPDPASRFQPEGPHGPSEVVDPHAYRWEDVAWRGPVAARPVLYEMHIGTYTAEGTWAAAARHLPALAELGVTVLEVMPVAEFPGGFGWGYDGVLLFAPFHRYGRPDDMRRFVDAAHAAGLGVILDVVYNHLGPDGNYLPLAWEEFFSRAHQTDWGAGINFDGAGSAAVRSFFRANVRHWMEEYHLDGLRFDATQDIHDASEPHILRELGEEARGRAGGRRCLLIAENEPQDARLVRRAEEGGLGLDAVWNDDFHHSAVVALTGRREAYFTDYEGSPRELVSCAKYGFLYQGQWYSWQRQGRGTSTRGVPMSAFVHFIENHDQVANSADGRRLVSLAGPARLRAMTALQLLMPGMALLFQGQEFGSTRPFLFFASHRADLAAAVRRGRGEFLRQFRSLAGADVQARLPDPSDEETFTSCVLDESERTGNVAWRALHRDLLALRHGDAVLSLPDAEVDGAVLGPEALVLRWFGAREDRLLVVNLGRELELRVVPEPLLAPLAAGRWTTVWSSESPDYGGRGTAPVEPGGAGWRIPGQCALVLAPATERSET